MKEGTASQACWKLLRLSVARRADFSSQGLQKGYTCQTLMGKSQDNILAGDDLDPKQQLEQQKHH